jgi:hypothetical protein
MKPIFWTSYCSAERHEATPAIKALVARHGSVVDFKMISDLSLTLVIELDSSRIKALYRDLQALIRLDDWHEVTPDQNDQIVYLNISFANQSGKLRNDIPAVPG